MIEKIVILMIKSGFYTLNQSNMQKKKNLGSKHGESLCLLVLVRYDMYVTPDT